MLRRSIASVCVLLLLVSAGMLWAADVNVTIKEWDTPGQNAHPHDSEVAPDGSLWYTGQSDNTLGRLDPKTGKIQVFKLTILAMADGTVWYSESNVAPNTLVRFDPKDNSFMKWPIPSGVNKVGI